MALTEFGKVRRKFERLTTTLAIANTHLDFYKKLRGAWDGEFEVELYKSKDFWRYTMGAHVQAAFVHLCRIYDKGRGFHLTHFVENIPQIPGVKLSPAEEAERQGDLDFLKNSPLVLKLRACRNKLIAHCDLEKLLNGIEEFLKENKVDSGEIQELIDKGFVIMERWEYHCADKTIQRFMNEGTLLKGRFKRIANHEDDYLHILQALRLSSIGTLK